MKNKNYYIGLDIGTDSVGYAACDEEYNLLKFHGNPAWGTTVFDSAKLSSERRGFRSARRRLDRRQQRVMLIKEFFAREIAKIDDRFFTRLSESGMWREDVADRYIFFNDEDYSDREYFKQYPTIHHLLAELMDNGEPHDVRLVYLACAWLVSHRGHFLSNVDEENIDGIKDFSHVYKNFIEYFDKNDCLAPWGDVDVKELGTCLKKKIGVTAKQKELIDILLDGKKPAKEALENFPFNQDCIIKLLAGGQCKVKDIFLKDEYEDLESISLGMADEKFEELAGNINDDYDLIEALRALYDWAVLADSIGDSPSVSHAKVGIYEQHKKDLKSLKYFIRKYCKDKYDDVFRIVEAGKANYVAYVCHSDDGDTDKLKRADWTEFSKFILKILETVKPVAGDEQVYSDMISRIKNADFLPKQRITNNRVIPCQLYLYELKKILKNASEYLTFLNEKDSDGLTVCDKIISVFKFKLPYFVGPLNANSDFAWLSRKADRITPWNYTKIIDLDKSEEEFIRRLTNQCTYLPGENVLPKDSLCYHKYMVLNELNNLRIDGRKLSVEQKQEIYTNLFMNRKKVTGKSLLDFCVSRGYLDKDRRDLKEAISGIDGDFKANLAPQISFRRLLEAGILSDSDVERIIERATYAEDKGRLNKWLKKEYSILREEDIKYICSLRIKDFGRLSLKFLTGIEGINKETGEVMTIMRALWETNNNLMELLSDRFTFSEELELFSRTYYFDHPQSLNDRLKSMYVSNAVKRPIFRTLDIVDDLRKAFGAPTKIFIEMTRGGSEDKKGKRTKSRYQQLLEYYSKYKAEDIKELKAQLENMGEYVENKLQADRLFLYFMQFGRCAYTDESIDIEDLMAGSKKYDIDHIYPQAYVKDDSIINNKVLVLSTANGDKKDVYPIQADIQSKMHGTWSYWHKVGTIGDEKYRRLTRKTPFSEEEKYGFINRQITETSQSTKAVAALLKEKFPDAEIVYTKARLASDFRQEYEIYKSRLFNDLHHAVDAYLNIVTGNVYEAIKTKTIFDHKVTVGGKLIWDPDTMKGRVIRTARKNTAHFTKYASFKTGGLFDQMPVKKQPEGLVPRKAGLSPEKYGGYNKAGIMFYLPVKYSTGKKTEILIMSVELLFGQRFLEDSVFAKEYTYKRVRAITGKDAEDISFPMGFRPWKVNTILSLDGFRICITGVGNRGKSLLAQPIMQFSLDDYWKYYVKKLEALAEKKSKNAKYRFDEEYDKVNFADNLKLYDIYIDKLQSSIYKKRINNPKDTLVNGKKLFEKLDIFEQTKVLLNIQTVFGRMTGGCDLVAIGGKTNSASTASGLSSSMTNWRKNYSDVRLIDQSPSGLWEKQSENLLDLL